VELWRRGVALRPGTLTRDSALCSFFRKLVSEAEGSLVAFARSRAVVMAGCLAFFATGCGTDSKSLGNQFLPSFPPATTPLVKLSTDTFTNSSSQHKTEVEPDSFSFGSTIVAAFQVGRISSGGSADIGYALSSDAGLTWQNGLLPGLTTFQGGGVNAAVSDPAVVYDAAHGVWIITSLTIANSGATQVVVSRSSDGGISWGNPLPVSSTHDPDKNWITCDNTPASPFYGHCYIEWDDFSQGDRIWMSTSADGGLTWSAAVNTTGTAGGIGGQPLVQPSGKVVVPMLGNLPVIAAFSSTDGGATWSAPVQVGSANSHPVAGGLRTDPLPSAQIDALGNIYVVWQSCGFRANCASNDLVMSTSADGITWTAPARIPIDARTSTLDHFIPGLGVDASTGGSGAHLGLTYYYYPVSNCTVTDCALYVGFISSLDGGVSWSAATPVAGPMSLNWLPSTISGLMAGDYIATSFAGGKAYGVFAVAKTKQGSVFDEAIYTTRSGFDVSARVALSRAEPSASSAGTTAASSWPDAKLRRSAIR